jgi:hypothetical protein
MSRSAAPDDEAVDPQQIVCFDAVYQELRREKRILREEYEAFSQFRRRVHSLDCTDEASMCVEPTVLDRAITDDSVPADSPIREAYAETVRSVSHYEGEYGDTYWESLAAEFGSEVAVALQQSETLTPVLKRRVCDAAKTAQSRRKQLIATIDAEHAAIDEAAATLRAIDEERVAIDSRPLYDCSPQELRRLRDDLTQLQERCQTLAVRRQAGDLEPETVPVRSASPRSVQEYLYQSLSSSYPVLSTLARISDRVERTKRSVEHMRSVVSG